MTEGQNNSIQARVNYAEKNLEDLFRRVHEIETKGCSLGMEKLNQLIKENTKAYKDTKELEKKIDSLRTRMAYGVGFASAAIIIAQKLLDVIF